jgi:hypothetical protein
MPAVEIRGNADLRKAMRQFTPDLEKTLKKELKRALVPVTKMAKGFVPSQAPMSGWAARSFSEGSFPQWSSSTIAQGITYSVSPSKMNKNGFSSMARIMNKSSVGAIYETAGRKNPDGQPWVGPKAGGTSKGVSRSSNPNAGKQFITNLGPLTSSLQGRGRLIYRAWRQSQNADPMGIAMRAIDEATTEFYSRASYTSFKKAA